MEQSFPVARPLRFGPLADRSFSLFVSRFPLMMRTCWPYFLTFWACLALLFWLLPRLPVAIPLWLSVWVWVAVCLPLWQWTLRRLHGTGRISSFGFLALLPPGLLGVPFFGCLVFALQAGEGVSWKQATARARQILLEHGDIVVGLMGAWLALPYLLANLFEFFTQGCLPYLLGLFDISLDTKAWIQPCLWAVQCLLAALVLPGFQLSLDLLRQEYSRCREGSELLAALEREYPA